MTRCQTAGDVSTLEQTDSRSPLPNPSIRAEWRYLAVLAAWFALAALASGAYRNVPVLDDWTYAWSVERLLHYGRFEVLDWSAVYPLGNTLWGAAWSWVLGFSFVTLRFSTLAMALVACAALYLLLRELEASPHLSLLGAAAVAANPVFFVLSSSFMTDVPFVAFTLMALLCYVRAMRRGEAHLLWWAGVWAFAAFLFRQIGIITPVAALPLLVVSRQSQKLERATVVRAVLVTYAVMFIGSLAITSIFKPTVEMTKLMDRLSWLFLVPATTYLGYNLYVLTIVAFYVLPALLAMATVRHLWRTRTLLVVVLATGALMLSVIGEIPLPLRPEGTWNLYEVGGSRALVAGALPTTRAFWIEMTLRAVGLLAVALALIACLRRDPATSGPASTFAPRASVDEKAGHGVRHVGKILKGFRSFEPTTRTPLLAYLAVHLVLVNVLWMYSDRYLLVLLPVVVALALAGRSGHAHVPRLAWGVIAAFAIVAIAGTRDALRFNQAVHDTWQSLVKSGVPPSDIDAGYVWNGWLLYAHPENLTNGLTADDVPWITSKRRPRYSLSKGQMDGYDVAREIEWSDEMSWPGTDRLLILKQRDPVRSTITAAPPKPPSKGSG